ncbi:MAG: OsmC family protein [Planctomycetes bacterium]|nr:OsmC family protein [Planctomycetota bacterium]MCB9903782.1 OsmC family protein [Planctomycetota bacterium]
MVRITTTYRGELRTSAVHGPSGSELVTDAPVDNQGRGESFSPTDLVATALGACMLTIMGIVAERHGWPLAGATVEVEKIMASDPRRIAKLESVIRIPGEWDDRQKKALETAALGCPVHRTLHGNVELPVRFEWGAA